MNKKEVFEAWFISEMPMESLIVDQDNNYKYQPAIASWEAWQAALAAQSSKQQILVDAITEVLRVLESESEAIVDTVWTTQGDNETLWEHCSHALEQVTGIEYKPAEQLPLNLQSQAQQRVFTFDQLTKLLMQAATEEGHKVTMKIKWAQPPAPEGGDK